MKIEINEDWKQSNGKYQCPHCEKEYARKGISTHIWRMHGDGATHNPNQGYETNRKGTNQYIKADEAGTAKPAFPEASKQKLSDLRRGTTLSADHKAKISASRIKFLKKNPDMVPYVLNHHSRGESYPEQYFRDILESSGIEFIQEKRESLYSLDFVIGNIDLEIDGEQHYVDTKIVASDKRRNKYLSGLGYEIIRVRWADYKRLSPAKQKEFVAELLIALDIKLGKVA